MTTSPWTTIDLSLPWDAPQVRAWYEAARVGFHFPHATDETIQSWWSDAVADGQTVRAAYGEARVGDPHAPAATLASAVKTINVGRALLPADLILYVTTRTADAGRGLMRDGIVTDLAAAAEKGLGLAALTASDARLYGRFGFGVGTWRWDLELGLGDRFGMVATPPGDVEQLTAEELTPLRRVIAADHHDRTPGSIGPFADDETYFAGRYDTEKQGPPDTLRAALHTADDGTPDGYVLYEAVGDWADKHLRVHQLIATSEDAALGLWHFLGGVRLVSRVAFNAARAHEPLAWALTDPRVLKLTGPHDFLWTRVLDPVKVFTARCYGADGEVVLAVTDPLGHAEGTFRITVSDGEASVARDDAEPDLTLDVATLSSIALGGPRVAQLAAAGRIPAGKAAETVRVLDTIIEPHSTTHF